MNDTAHPTEDHEHEHEHAIVCSHVYAGKRPALFALRSHEDGVLQITCGAWEDDERDGAAELVCADDLLTRDPSLAEAFELEAGQLAERADSESEWEIEEYDEETYDDVEIEVSEDDPVRAPAK